MAESFEQITQNPSAFKNFAREFEHNPSKLSEVFFGADGKLAVTDKKDRDDFLSKLVNQANQDADAAARDQTQRAREAEQRGKEAPHEAPLPRFELTGALAHAQKVELKVAGDKDSIYTDKLVSQKPDGKPLEHYEEVKIGDRSVKVDIPYITCSAPGQTYKGKVDCW